MGSMMRLSSSIGFDPSNNSILSTARSLALLSSLCFPTFTQASASEVEGPEAAQSTQESNDNASAPSTAKERAILKDTLETLLVRSRYQAGDPKMQIALSDAISRYCDALIRAGDLTCLEFDAASSLAISQLNVISTRDNMPNETANKFIVEDVLKLHCTLIDRLHSKDSVPPLTPVQIEQRTYSLFDDILWCKNYNAPEIFSGACDKLCQRIIPANCPHLVERIEYLACKIDEHPQLKDNSVLAAQAAEVFREVFSKYPSHADNFQPMNRLFELVLPSDELVIEFRKIISNLGTQPEAAPFFLDLVGPALGGAFAHQMKCEIDAKLASEIIGPNKLPSFTSSQVINDSLSMNLPKKLGQESKLSAAQLLVRDVIEQSLKGSNWQSFITATDEKPTWGELEKRGVLRTNCLALSLGILNGFDRAIQPDDFAPILDDPATEVYTPELMKNVWRITLYRSRQELRSRFNDLITLQQSDESRARLVVNMMVSDSRCYETLVKSDPFQAQSLAVIGDHFPDAIAGNRSGRYSSKIGGIRYVPAILVEGSPAPYADAYFYIRDSLVSTRYGKSWSELEVPNKDANDLALKYARAHQTVFICELAKLLWGVDQHTRPFDRHRNLTDQRMHQEILLILNKFGAYKDDLDLIFDPRLKEPSTFIAAIEEHQVQAKQQRLQLHSTVKKQLGQ